MLCLINTINTISHLARVALSHEAHLSERSPADHGQRLEVSLRQPLAALANS